MQTLKDLDHPGIPRYLDDFETPDGFCLVQEYKQARMLSELRNLPLDATKRIAVGLLEILIYLQDCTPPVIHRDIKPENVLVDDNFNVYLIDFGFARIGNGSIALSSVNAGTFGFMAPEQIRNLKLTNASDLYSLGLTLICAIARISSNEIGKYIDWNNQLDRNKIDAKLKHCSQHLITWLRRMTAPNPAERFTDARDALAAFRIVTLERLSAVSLEPKTLKLEAHIWGDVVTERIFIANTTPSMTFKGYWEIAPHPYDPPHTPDHHPWISISPRTIHGNLTTCTVTVHSHRLTPDSVGERQLVLRSNHGLEAAHIPLQVTTGTNPERLNPPIGSYFFEALLVFLEGLGTTLLALSAYIFHNSFLRIVDYKDIYWSFATVLLPLIWVPVIIACGIEVLTAKDGSARSSSATLPWKRGTGLLIIALAQLGCLLFLSHTSLIPPNGYGQVFQLMRQLQHFATVFILLTGPMAWALILSSVALGARRKQSQLETFRQRKIFLVTFACRLFLATVIPLGIILLNIHYCYIGVCHIAPFGRGNYFSIFFWITIFLLTFPWVDPIIIPLIRNRGLAARYRKVKGQLIQP